MPPPRLMSCRLCGWAELRCRLRLCSPAPNQYRTFAQSAAYSRRPVARRSSRQTFPSSSSSPSSQPSTSPPPGGREEHRESSSRTARQSTPVSVNSLAALRRAAFEPPSPSGQSDEDATLSHHRTLQSYSTSSPPTTVHCRCDSWSGSSTHCSLRAQPTRSRRSHRSTTSQRSEHSHAVYSHSRATYHTTQRSQPPLLPPTLPTTRHTATAS